jgi:hypothetical protein
MPLNSLLLDSKEAGELLGLPELAVKRLMDRGELPTIFIEGKTRVHRRHVEQLAEARALEAEQDAAGLHPLWHAPGARPRARGRGAS